EVGRCYFTLAESLQFMELFKKAESIATPNRWDRLALQSLIHEMFDELARITAHVLASHKGSLPEWEEADAAALSRVQVMVADMLKRDALSTPMLMVALRQMKSLAIK